MKSKLFKNICNNFCKDFYNYIIHNPKKDTLIKFNSLSERNNYCARILQRIDISVNEYSVLNIHKIGINIPIQFIFEELLQWDGQSFFWPNQLAKVKRINNKLDNILIYLFGLEKIKIPLLKNVEINLIPLFHLSALKIQHYPKISETDNPRYLLYKCSGGYPIGVFCIYVRNSIFEENEMESAQLFSLVAFDFYGKNNLFYRKIINPIWQKMHNRATSNILNRMKFSFEEKFIQYTKHF